MSDYVQTGDIEQIQLEIRSVGGGLATGLSNVAVKVRRSSDGFFLDWADMTFKAAGWATVDQPAVAADGTNAPGIYEVTGGLDLSAIVNPVANDTLTVLPVFTSGGAGLVLPGSGQIRVGAWADDAGKIDKIATLSPVAATTGSLLDRVANKDGSKTYNPATDSLEAIKDRIG